MNPLQTAVPSERSIASGGNGGNNGGSNRHPEEISDWQSVGKIPPGGNGDSPELPLEGAEEISDASSAGKIPPGGNGNGSAEAAEAAEEALENQDVKPAEWISATTAARTMAVSERTVRGWAHDGICVAKKDEEGNWLIRADTLPREKRLSLPGPRNSPREDPPGLRELARTVDNLVSKYTAVVERCVYLDVQNKELTEKQQLLLPSIKEREEIVAAKNRLEAELQTTRASEKAKTAEAVTLDAERQKFATELSKFRRRDRRLVVETLSLATFSLVVLVWLYWFH